MSHNIKLIVTDLDGTFVPNIHEVIKENLAALKAAKAAGIRVVACTGRHWGQAQCVLAASDFDEICITSHGSAVVSTRTGEDKRLLPLHDEWMPKIYQYLESIGISIEKTRVCDRFCYYGIDPTIREEWEDRLQWMYGTEHPSMTRVFRTPELFLSAERGRSERLLFTVPCCEAEDLMRIQQELVTVAPVVVTNASGTEMELINQHAGKHNGAKWVAQYYGIERTNVLAIGDGFNDIPMVQWAGVGVAMGNAKEALKEVADIVAPNVADGGFAKVVYDCIEGRI